MQIDITIIIKCKIEINNALEAYRQHSLGVSREVNFLLSTCRLNLSKSIVLIETLDDSQTIETTSIPATYIALPDGSYAICYIKNLNNCWKRFVLCKELFHVLLDNPEYANIELINHIEHCTSEAPDLGPTPASAQIEFFAEYSAMEFLFPFEERLKIKEASSDLDFAKIAETYKVPRIYVERYLTDSMINVAKIIKGLPDSL